MKKLFTFILVMIVLTIQILADVSGSFTITGNRFSVYKTNNGGVSYWMAGNQDIGTETLNGVTNVYRSYFSFFIGSIPSNYTITSVTVSYQNLNQTNYSQALKNLDSVPSGAEQLFDAIGTGTLL
jgi:hypothetical protein